MEMSVIEGGDDPTPNRNSSNSNNDESKQQPTEIPPRVEEQVKADKSEPSTGAPPTTTTVADSPTRSLGSNSQASLSTVPPLSPPLSPASRTAAVATPPLSPSNKHHRGLHNTPQMMVLGKDGSDFQDLMTSRQQALLEEEKKTEEFADEPSEHSSSHHEQQQQQQQDGSTSWWKSLWYGKKTAPVDRRNQGNAYSSVRHAPGLSLQSSSTLEIGDEEAPVYYQSYVSPEKKAEDGSPQRPLEQQQPAAAAARNQNNNNISLGKMHQSILRNLPLPTTKEDQIEQDCSFLYRRVDERNGYSPKRNSNSRGLRVVLETPPEGVSTLYRDAQDVLSPPAVAQYQAKYHQLNQEFTPKDDDRFEDYNDYAVTPPVLAVASEPHELTLEEQQEQGQQQQSQSQHSVVTSSTSQSSLFYQHEANGRVVLRLPRDHVRLLVASPHETMSALEPGILSVIQCRRPDDPPSKQLEYCLTVPSNLYQRVVSEMSRANKRKHHHNNTGSEAGLNLTPDHADIRIAVLIMVVIMIILGIFTLGYGLD